MSESTPPHTAHAAMAGAVNAKTAGFCVLLRQTGFVLGLRETQDALRVGEMFLCTDFPAFRDGMRSLLCASEAQQEVFETLFTGYWCPEDGARRIVPMSRSGSAGVRPERRQPRDGRGMPMTTGFSDRPDAQGETRLTSGASMQESTRRPDLSALPAAHQQRLERAAERIWRRLRIDKARRLRGNRWRRRLNVRRTLRRNLSNGGELFSLVLSGRKPAKPRLVVLLDVSGSMELHSFLFLRLLHALQKRFRKVASFVFSTALVEVTPALAHRNVEPALAAVSRLRLGWHGGTRIGECLRRLVDEHGGRLLRPDTAFVILSDGLDVGPPEALAEALGRVRRRVNRVIWLNPLLATRGYEPTARGMAAALPLVDVFAPAHDLDSLLDIESHLMK